MRPIVSDTEGNLVLRLKILGHRFSEQTMFTDIPKNRAYLQATLTKINYEIKIGVFDYALHFPHSKNTLVINALKSKFLSPGWRGLPTFKHFLLNEYHGKQNEVGQILMICILGSLGDQRVNEILGYNILKLKDMLKTIKGITKPNFVAAMEFVFKILDQAALVYVFPRPFKLVLKDDGGQYARPLCHRDILQVVDNVPLKYREVFLLQYYTGLSSKDLVELEWKQYSVKDTTFYLPEREVYIDPYARRLLFQMRKKSGNSRYVLGAPFGKKLKINHCWLSKECWPKACQEIGREALPIHVLKRASIFYLYEAGLSVDQICQQTQILFRPVIHQILSQHILN
jgi:integrase